MPINKLYDCYGTEIIIETEEDVLQPAKLITIEDKRHYRIYFCSVFNYLYNKVKNCPFYGNYADIIQKDNSKSYEVIIYEAPLLTTKLKLSFRKLREAIQFIEGYITTESLYA